MSSPKPSLISTPYATLYATPSATRGPFTAMSRTPVHPVLPSTPVAAAAATLSTPAWPPLALRRSAQDSRAGLAHMAHMAGVAGLAATSLLLAGCASLAPGATQATTAPPQPAATGAASGAGKAPAATSATNLATAAQPATRQAQAAAPRPATPPAPSPAPQPGATPPSPAAPGATAAPANPPAAAGAAARPPAPGTPAPFAEVTKAAKRQDGFLPIWTRDDKTWLEIPANRLDQPFFLGSSLASGVGEAGFWPGMMGDEQVVVLRRVGNTVQLLARNLHARGAAPGSPLAQALNESYSDSLLAAVPLAAAPQTDSKALLVDALALLGGDLPGVQPRLEAAYRLPYALDRANTHVLSARPGAQGTHLVVRSHYAVPRLPTPPAPGSATPPNPAAMPRPSQVLADPRSLFLNLAYTLAPLPEQPMAPRLADARVGYFTQAWLDFGKEAGGDHKRTHVINRWRLEKTDPTAELSPPKAPIRVVMDRNIPEKWRAPVRAGILAWNTAFERAGFQNALVVEQQPADADWASTEGTRMLAVRWFAMEGPGATAVGPSQVDPRTGEILRGASIIPENWVRIGRVRLNEIRPPIAGMASHGLDSASAHSGGPVLPGDFAARFATCTLAEDALAQRDFAFELMAARGEIDPDSPAADQFIADSLKDVTMHEVGHALGLRHNFKASTGITRQQLRDPAFTAARGISNSVMDYVPLNVPLQGETRTAVQMGQLGAYDLWAIEYGYRQHAPEQEAAALRALAARSANDDKLRYATDEDASGPDPEANRFDLGDDPLAYAQRQLVLARELWQRTTQRQLPPDDDLTIYRKNLERVLASYRGVLPLATRYVGGVHTLRATAGAGVPLLRPVDAARQRQALDLVVGELFASSSFRFEPQIMARLGVNHQERLGRNTFVTNTDFSLPAAVIGIQRPALDYLMADSLAQRLADAETKVSDRKQLLSFAEVQQRLQDAVWAELGPNSTKARAAGSAPGDIDTLRRNLQREHLKRLSSGLLRPANGVSADAPAVNREQARALEASLRAALARGGWSATARAHLADSLATVGEALRAPLARQGV